MTPVRVMVVDDRAVVRDGLRALLATRDDVEVVGTAADGIEALRVARDCHPQAVLMGLGMPRMDGVEATRRLVATHPTPAVIVLTASADDTAVPAAVRAGARGYLLTDADGDEVVAAIHAVTSSQAVFGTGVASAVLAMLHAPPVHREPPFAQLTERERQVLDLVAAGWGNQEIGRQLRITPKTVANLVSGVLVKLGSPDRAAVAERARAAGLGAGGRPRAR